MKKMIGCLLLLSLLLVFAGCGSAKTPTPDDSNTAAGFSAQDIALQLQGKTYALDDSVAGLIEAMGDAYEYSEAQSCAYEGVDKLYDYGYALVATVPPGGQDIIAEVYVSDGTELSTPKGIGIGSAKSEIEAAYGTGYTLEENILTYWAGDEGGLQTPKLYFVMENDVVTAFSIFSGRNAG